MNRSEALEALMQGKAIRHKAWIESNRFVKIFNHCSNDIICWCIDGKRSGELQSCHITSIFIHEDNGYTAIEKQKNNKRVTNSGNEPELPEDNKAPAPIDEKTGQHKDYWVLSDQERSKGFVRPVRDTYVHDKCGVATTMSRKIAETYARDPKFYGSTFCVGSNCKEHFPVGEFKWDDGSVVGS